MKVVAVVIVPETTDVAAVTEHAAQFGIPEYVTLLMVLDDVHE